MTEVVAALIWDQDKFMICQRPREIIEKHAGTITVSSGKKKKGSAFVIQ